MGVDGHLYLTILAGCRGRENLADLVRNDPKAMIAGNRRHALAPPAGDIGDAHLGIDDEMDLRRDQDPPSPWPAASAVERLKQLALQRRLCPRIGPGGPGLGVELAEENLTRQAFG